MNRKLLLSGLIGTIALTFVFSAVETAFSGQNKSMKSTGIGATGTLAGTGTLSGSVKAPKEFKAAKVYARNVDKNVVYMVFTEDGKYQAVDLFPGNYEVSVTKNGFSGGDVQKVSVTAGGNATADFSLKDEPTGRISRCASACPRTNRFSPTTNFIRPVTRERRLSGPASSATVRISCRTSSGMNRSGMRQSI